MQQPAPELPGVRPGAPAAVAAPAPGHWQGGATHISDIATFITSTTRTTLAPVTLTVPTKYLLLILLLFIFLLLALLLLLLLLLY